MNDTTSTTGLLTHMLCEEGPLANDSPLDEADDSGLLPNGNRVTPTEEPPEDVIRPDEPDAPLPNPPDNTTGGHERPNSSGKRVITYYPNYIMSKQEERRMQKAYDELKQRVAMNNERIEAGDEPFDQYWIAIGDHQNIDPSVRKRTVITHTRVEKDQQVQTDQLGVDCGTDVTASLLKDPSPCASLTTSDDSFETAADPDMILEIPAQDLALAAVLPDLSVTAENQMLASHQTTQVDPDQTITAAELEHAIHITPVDDTRNLLPVQTNRELSEPQPGQQFASTQRNTQPAPPGFSQVLSPVVPSQDTLSKLSPVQGSESHDTSSYVTSQSQPNRQRMVSGSSSRETLASYFRKHGTSINRSSYSESRLNERRKRKLFSPNTHPVLDCEGQEDDDYKAMNIGPSVLTSPAKYSRLCSRRAGQDTPDSEKSPSYESLFARLPPGRRSRRKLYTESQQPLLSGDSEEVSPPPQANKNSASSLPVTTTPPPRPPTVLVPKSDSIDGTETPVVFNTDEKESDLSGASDEPIFRPPSHVSSTDHSGEIALPPKDVIDRSQQCSSTGDVSFELIESESEYEDCQSSTEEEFERSIVTSDKTATVATDEGMKDKQAIVTSDNTESDGLGDNEKQSQDSGAAETSGSGQSRNLRSTPQRYNLRTRKPDDRKFSANVCDYLKDWKLPDDLRKQYLERMGRDK